MEKHILRWSYWLGIACLVIALVWRGINAFGIWLPPSTTPGYTIWYLSFFRGSLLFFVASIATANYIWVDLRKP